MTSFAVFFSLLFAAPQPDEVARAVAELGDARYAVREQAERRLWEMGSAAEAAVRAAVKSPDPETQRRARQIIEKFDWGVYPDTPPAIVAQIGRYRAGDEDGRQQAVRELVKAGRPGYPALAKIVDRAGPEERPGLSAALGQAASEGLPRLVRANDLDSAERLLEIGLAAESEAGPILDHYVAVLLMTGRLAAARPAWDERAGAGSTRAAEIAGTLARAAGDLPAARALAVASRRDELLDRILWEQGDWAALAAREPPATGRRAASAADLGVKAFCQRLAGDEAAFAATVTKLTAATDPEEGTPERVVAAQALLLNGRPAEALKLLSAISYRSFEFDLHTYRLDYAAALTLAARPVTEEMIDRKGRLRMQAARTLAMLGETVKAREAFAAASGEEAAPIDGSTVAALLKAEKQAGFTNEALAHAVRYLDAVSGQAVTESTDPSPAVLEVFLPKRGADAAVWWRFLAQREPKTAASGRFKQVMSLFDPPKGTRPPVPAELAAAFLAGIPEDPVAEQVKGLQSLAAAYAAAGQDELARRYFTRAGERTNASPDWIRLGDFERKLGRHADAAEAYGRAADRPRSPALAYYLRADALVRSGRADEAREAAGLAFRLSAGMFVDRVQLAAELAERGLTAEAKRERDFVLRAIGDHEWYVGNLLSQLAHEALARKEFARAADLWERVAAGCLRQGTQFIEPAAYLNVPRLTRLCRARAALAAGEFPRALMEADAVLALSPGDLDVPIKLAPELAKHRPDAADALYRRVTAVYRDRLKQFPNSPMLHNGLAWAAACCRRDLDEALGHARAAVAAGPAVPSYLDTLAEVLFQRGEQAAAIATIRKALTVDPDNAYYQSQLSRMEANDRSSAPAEPE